MILLMSDEEIAEVIALADVATALAEALETPGSWCPGWPVAWPENPWREPDPVLPN